MKGSAGFRSLMFLLAFVLLVQVPVAWAQDRGEGDSSPQVSAAPDAPTIIVWYGDTQNFGVLGNPQKQINILGNVISADNLYYSLNDGPYNELSIGTAGSTEPPLPLTEGPLLLDPHGPVDLTVAGNKRLLNKGDFNIEILTADLVQGKNTIAIKAVGTGETIETVTVNYTKGTTWPLPYVVDWTDFASVQDVLNQGKAQIVDGEWYLDEEDGKKWLRPVATAIGYDRLVTLGDIQWKDYDALVLLHLEEFPIDNIGNIGALIRWQGHHERGIEEQPVTGWWESGAFGFYRHYTKVLPEDPDSRLEMFIGHYERLVDTSGFRVKRTDPYYFRLRVQTTGLAPYGLYSMKVWKLGDPEPAEWVFVEKDVLPDAVLNGSLLLVAHEADVRFGKVEIKPIVKVNVTTVGPGRVDVTPKLVSPADAYLYGDTITLNAIPDDPANYVFSGWSGDLTGYQNPASLNLIQNVNITATFAPKQTLSLGINPTGAGQVELDPPGGTYGPGTVVKLTPKPNPNWAFGQWSGPNAGELVNLGNGAWSITMNGNKSVTANFVSGYSLTITTSGNGTVITDPPGAGFPAGTRVKLTAKPDFGWGFFRWQGDLTGRQNPIWLTMDSNKVIQAVFGEVTYAFLPLVTRNAR